MAKNRSHSLTIFIDSSLIGTTGMRWPAFPKAARISDPARERQPKETLNPPPPRRASRLEVLDLFARPQCALVPRAVAARLAQSAREVALRRGHRWGRRPWPRNRVLPHQGAWHQQRGGAGKGLSRRWQHRPQHHHCPLQLSPRPQRTFLRDVAQALGG